MKLQLETVQYSKSKSSFHFFKREEPNFQSFRHFHPELELTYIERGSGIRYIGDNISSFESGDLVLIGENLPHDYVTTNPHDSMHSSASVFQFPTSLLDSIPEGQSLRSLFKDANYGIQFESPSIQLIKKIQSVSIHPSLENFVVFLEILNQLQNHTNRRPISSISFSNNTIPKGNQSKISNVTKYISEHFHQPISIHQMAQLVHMTPQSFCRWFKQSIGCSFVSYLNATRVEKACQLLLQTNLRIAHISFEVGFETVSHFNRTFKKIKKATPKDYRKMDLG
ncbi:MAG: AraC family transcriptional regulator [Bacteroidota bacterium]